MNEEKQDPLDAVVVQKQPPLTKAHVRAIATEITKLSTDWDSKDFSLEEDFSKKLKKLDLALDEYLELCSKQDAREEIIASSIDRHLLPAFPYIMKRLADQAKTGSSQDVKTVLDLMSKVSTLLSQFSKRGENHLHLHYEKMPEVQLLEEGLYQVKQFLKMQLQLPGGTERVQELIAEMWREHYGSKAKRKKVVPS